MEGKRSWLDRLRDGKSQLASTTEELKRIEKKTRLDPAKSRGWTVYDSGALGEYGYFKDSPRATFNTLVPFEELKSRIADRKKEGARVMVLDIMGQGRVGYDLGADESIGWTYKKHGEEKLPGRTIETGDLFDKEVLRQHLNKLRKRQQKSLQLTDVFWRSEGGFGTYLENQYALAYIYTEVFSPVFALAPIGTRFFLGMGWAHPGPPAIMRALREEGYDIESNDTGYYLLTKTEEKPTLPGLRMLAKKYRLDEMVPEKP